MDENTKIVLVRLLEIIEKAQDKIIALSLGTGVIVKIDTLVEVACTLVQCTVI